MTSAYVGEFHYTEYKHIIERLQKHFTFLDYDNIDSNTDNFCVVRHDVEFSTERAHQLALFEHQVLGIKSNYFFQIRNNCYNIFSDKNISLIRDIYEMGYNIGLHAHMEALESIDDLKEYIVNDINILQTMIKVPVNRFSFHRPKREHLEANLKIDGIVNTYGEKYFDFTDDLSNLNVTYLSDSNHRWLYGYPLHIDFNNVKKLQLLFHPYSWTEGGFNNYDNFVTLLKEKEKEMVVSIENECKSFPKELL